MSLKNVRNMGTEGRRGGENEIPPGENINSMIKFRVDLIKNFNIIEKPDSDEEEDDVDPAIVSATPSEEPQRKPQWNQKPR